MKKVKGIIDATATAYVLAYKCLMEKNMEVCNSFQDDISIYIFPAMTIAALACEIAIKDKLKAKTKGHELDKLFNKLDANQQNKYREHTKELYNIRNKILGRSTSLKILDFEQELQDCKDIFIKCRYLYESKLSVNIGFLESFLFAINDADDEYVEYLNFLANKYNIGNMQDIKDAISSSLQES